MTQEIILMNKKDIPSIEQNFFVIKKMGIKEQDTLLIQVTYYGGCKEHIFRLFGYFDDNTNIVFLLEHNANGDQCKSILRKDLLFDLSPIKAKFEIKNKNNLKKRSLTLNLKNMKTKYEVRN